MPYRDIDIFDGVMNVARDGTETREHFSSFGYGADDLPNLKRNQLPAFRFQIVGKVNDYNRFSPDAALVTDNYRVVLAAQGKNQMDVDKKLDEMFVALSLEFNKNPRLISEKAQDARLMRGNYQVIGDNGYYTALVCDLEIEFFRNPSDGS